MTTAIGGNGSSATVSRMTATSLDDLTARHGPSFYLASGAHFERNFRRFLDAFRAIYPRTRIGYSYKTNYLASFIRRAHHLGAYAEVVSRFEFELAERLGVDGARIVFNGPVKTRADLAHAFAAGAMVNADSLPEVWEMIGVADRLSTPAKAGIRCTLGEHTPGSRFGVDLGTPEARAALAALDAAANLRLAGLHCHHSGDRAAERYRQRTRAMIDVHRQLLGGRPLDYLDIGGGFGGSMSPALASQLASPVATFEQYAEAVAGEMWRAYGSDGPELIVEPGMALLADTMTFVSRVQSVKLQGRCLAVVDGSAFNIQPPWNILRERINLPMRIVSARQRSDTPDGPWDVVGHTCIEADVLHRGHPGPINIGDYVVFDNVGAYTNVLNAPFIRGTPPIVEFGADGSERVLRRRSTPHDLLRSYASEAQAALPPAAHGEAAT